MARNREVLFVIGTRPEIIKTAPVLRAVEDSSILDTYLAHTSQHYDENMSAAFFEALDLDSPDEHLGVGSGSQAEQTATGLVAVERLLEKRGAPIVLAQGDTNTVLSTALAASKLQVAFGHIEAGIRSFDRSMPEEINRVIADHVADLCFAPTPEAVDNLAAEGIREDVHETGNTVVDACCQHRPIAESSSKVLDRLDLSPGSFAVVTIHRPINADDPDRLATILAGFDDQDFPVVFPCHPRTEAAIDELGFESSGSLRLVNPMDYLDFLALETNARLIVTDSGGIQEEASILEVPCLTVRPNTERPETIDAGVNELVEPGDVADEMDSLFHDDARHSTMRGASNLYGDGRSGERIATILEDRFSP